jgi:predicted permease
MIESFLRDAYFGIRQFWKNPGLTLVAILSLSVGIGVNSTVFGFVNAVVFKTMNVSNGDGLVYVFAGDRRNPYRPSSYDQYTEFRKQNDVFSDLAAYAAPPMLMSSGERSEEVTSEVVSGNYFFVFDVRMQLGRGFGPEHDQLSFSEPSVVISDNFWRRHLGSAGDVLGKQIVLNGNSFSVIGVTPASFTGTDPTTSTDVWMPITQWATMIIRIDNAAAIVPPGANAKAQANTANKPPANDAGRLGRDQNWLSMIGRLKRGNSLEHAQSVMATIATRLESNTEPKEPLVVTLSSVTSVHPLVREEIPAAIFIMAVTSLILMICCVNVASLMLARAAARRREFAIRVAFGSSRQRLVRQLMTEALLLSIAGGILGLVFAYWTTRAVLGFMPPGDLGFSAGVSFDQRVLWYSLAISVVTALLFGLLPAIHSFRPNLVQSLGSTMMSPGNRKKINLRRVLVVLQIVASLVLLISTGLFLRSFQRAQEVSESFRSHRMLILDMNPKKYGYSVKYSKAFYRELLARIGHMPGVEAVSLTNVVPLVVSQDNTQISIDGREPKYFARSIISEDYFRTFNIPIALGREFGPMDDDAARKVVIVNEALTRTYWPGENPLGKLIRQGPNTYEIVGVAKDSPYNGVGNISEPHIYMWLYQRMDKNVMLMIRTSGEPRRMITAVQREVKDLGGNLPIFDFKTLDEVSNSQLVPVKAAAALLSVLSFIGVLVASIGIYGVTSYAFNQRKREIGIRMSLGAQRSDILTLIMKEGVGLAVVGIVIGVLIALGTTHFVSSFLYGVSPVDPVVFFGVAALLCLVAVGASLVPAITAARSNPVEALRYE